MMAKRAAADLGGATRFSIRGGRSSFLAYTRRLAAWLLPVLVLSLLTLPLLLTGCSTYRDPNVPNAIEPRQEPEYGGEYLLYRPSRYDAQQAWPLFVVCPGSFPDSASHQIKQWTQHAEAKGMLLLAPELESAGRTWLSDEGKAFDRLVHDEEHILACLRHVQASNNISRDRIFIYGWSSGARAALFAGLRNPEVFRAIALAEPRFAAGPLSRGTATFDRKQPIFVAYSPVDLLTRDETQACVAWLHKRFAHVTEARGGSVDSEDTSPSLYFFEHVLQREPWLHVRAFPLAEEGPLTYQFKLLTSFEPVRLRWEFGDGDGAVVAEPIHQFAEPGVYRIDVEVEDKKGAGLHRTMYLVLPDGVLRYGPFSNE
jgi:dienelactone hydrolase